MKRFLIPIFSVSMRRLLIILVLFLAIGSVAVGEEKRSSSVIISDAIEGKLERTVYWLLMSSTATNSGWERIIRVSGFGITTKPVRNWRYGASQIL